MSRRARRIPASRPWLIAGIVAALLVVVPPFPADAATDRLPDLRSAKLRDLRIGDFIDFPYRPVTLTSPEP